MKNTVNTINTENQVNLENTINTENMVNTENTINTENMVNTENTINTENMVNPENTINTENTINLENTVIIENQNNETEPTYQLMTISPPLTKLSKTQSTKNFINHVIHQYTSNNNSNEMDIWFGIPIVMDGCYFDNEISTNSLLYIGYQTPPPLDLQVYLKYNSESNVFDFMYEYDYNGFMQKAPFSIEFVHEIIYNLLTEGWIVLMNNSSFDSYIDIREHPDINYYISD